MYRAMPVAAPSTDTRTTTLTVTATSGPATSLAPTPTTTLLRHETESMPARQVSSQVTNVNVTNTDEADAHLADTDLAAPQALRAIAGLVDASPPTPPQGPGAVTIGLVFSSLMVERSKIPDSLWCSATSGGSLGMRPLTRLPDSPGNFATPSVHRVGGQHVPPGERGPLPMPIPTPLPGPIPPVPVPQHAPASSSVGSCADHSGNPGDDPAGDLRDDGICVLTAQRLRYAAGLRPRTRRRARDPGAHPG